MITIALLVMGAYLPLVLLQRKIPPSSGMYNEYHRKEQSHNRLTLLGAVIVYFALYGFVVSHYPADMRHVLFGLFIALAGCSFVMSITGDNESSGSYFKFSLPSLTQIILAFIAFGIFVALMVMKFTVQ